MDKSGSTTVSKNFDTPISQLPSQLNAGSFDDYVLIGKKDNTLTIYSNGQESTTQSWLNEVGIGYDSEALTQEPETV